MLRDVAGDERDALLGADDRFQLRPLRLQLLAAVGLLAFGHFLEAGIDRQFLALVEGQFLVVVEHADLVAADPAGGISVLHGDAGDEHPMEVAVAGLQRRPGRAGQPAQRVVEGVVGRSGLRRASADRKRSGRTTSP